MLSLVREKRQRKRALKRELAALNKEIRDLENQVQTAAERESDILDTWDIADGMGPVSVNVGDDMVAVFDNAHERMWDDWINSVASNPSEAQPSL